MGSGWDDVIAPADDLLVARAQGGDLRAFERLVRRHSPTLYRLAYRLSGSPTSAEDVLQDVWLAAWRFLPGFSGRSTLLTWLHRLTVNAALQTARRTVPPPVTDTEVAARSPAAASAEDVGQRSSLRAAVRAAVLALAPDLRAPVVLRYFHGMGPDEIAEVLEVSSSTVRGRLYRGRQQLAAALADWR